MDTRTSGILYITVVQAIIPLGLETWVVTDRIDRLLGSFHQVVAEAGGWDVGVTPLGDAMRDSGIEEIGT